MTISLIVACDWDMGIGFENKLLCHLPNDLKYFKEKTQGNYVCMGSNTFHSIGKALPTRQNIVISRKDKSEFPSNVYVYDSVESVLKEYKNYAEEQIELFVIGGQSLYEQFIDYADKVYMTLIDHRFDNVDTWFPRLDDNWIPVRNIRNEPDNDNPYIHYFLTFERKQK